VGLIIRGAALGGSAARPVKHTAARSWSLSESKGVHRVSQNGDSLQAFFKSLPLRSKTLVSAGFHHPPNQDQPEAIARGEHAEPHDGRFPYTGAMVEE